MPPKKLKFPDCSCRPVAFRLPTACPKKLQDFRLSLSNWACYQNILKVQDCCCRSVVFQLDLPSNNFEFSTKYRVSRLQLWTCRLINSSQAVREQINAQKIRCPKTDKKQTNNTTQSGKYVQQPE